MVWLFVLRRVELAQSCCDLLMDEVLTDPAGKKPVQEDGRV